MTSVLEGYYGLAIAVIIFAFACIFSYMVMDYPDDVRENRNRCNCCCNYHCNYYCNTCL